MAREEFDVNEPLLPGKQQAPARFEEGTAVPHFPQSVEGHYWPKSFQAIDFIVVAIHERFNQDGLNNYLHLENPQMNVVSGQDFNK